jgi:hypothetical protein
MEARMGDITEAEVLKRAKQNCEKAKFDWELTFRQPAAHFSPLNRPQALDQAGRDRYLAEARKELADERKDDA